MPEYILKRGNICNLSVLLGYNTGKRGITTYASGDTKCSVIPFNNGILRDALNEDPDLILPKFYRKMSPRYMILAEVPQFKNLSQGTVKFFCYMNTFKVYKDKAVVALPNGGIVLKGNLKHSDRPLT